MKAILIIIFILQNIIIAQVPNANFTEKDPSLNSKVESVKRSDVFFGANLSIYLWNRSYYFGLLPMVGLNITDKLAVGGRIGYAYLTNESYNPTLKSHNYGGGIFVNYKLIPQVYVQGEYLYFSLEKASNINQSNYIKERVGVPFLLFGIGYIHHINYKVSVLLELSYDILQDSNSPFSSGGPYFRIGFGIGI